MLILQIIFTGAIDKSTTHSCTQHNSHQPGKAHYTALVVAARSSKVGWKTSMSYSEILDILEAAERHLHI